MTVLTIVISSTTARSEMIQVRQIPQCINKNKFLPILQNSGVIIFTSPKPEINHCTAEWSKFGTCCSVKSLIEYTKMDRLRIENAKDEVRSSMAKLFRNLTNLFDLTSELEPHFKKIISQVRRQLVHTLNQPKFQTLAEKVRNITQRHWHYNAFSNCYSLLADLRANSLCSTCSGASERFFFDNSSKAVISTNTCLSVMKACARSFFMTIWFMDRLDELIDELLDLPGIRDLESLRLEVAKVDRVADLVRETQVLRNFAQLRNESRSLEEKQAIRASICEKMINLAKPTHIQQLAKLFRNESQALPILINRLLATKKDLGLQDTGNSRRLNQLDPNDQSVDQSNSQDAENWPFSESSQEQKTNFTTLIPNNSPSEQHEQNSAAGLISTDNKIDGDVKVFPDTAVTTVTNQDVSPECRVGSGENGTGQLQTMNFQPSFP